MKATKPLRFLPVAWMALSLCLPAMAAREIWVDLNYTGPFADGSPGAPYRTLTLAQQSAQPGDTIHIRPGAYNESIRLNKPLRIGSTGGMARVGTSQPCPGYLEPISYRSFQNASLILHAWPGQHHVFLTQSASLDHCTLIRIRDVFDHVYEFYQTTTRQSPIAYSTHRGLLTIAEVQDTCGAGCGYLGFTGIELMPETFNVLYQSVKDRNEFDQALFYEFGRNFWFYGSKLEYKPPQNSASVTTGYAVFMRFLSMESAGVQGGPYNGVSFTQFRQAVEGLVDSYQSNPTLNWHNTLAVGQAPSNPLNLGGADLFASFLFRLRRDYGGNSFVTRLWYEVNLRPAANTTQDTVDNFVVAASKAAGHNLANLFTSTWRWPLSQSALVELGQIPL